MNLHKLKIPDDLIDLEQTLDICIRAINGHIVKIKGAIHAEWCEITPELGDYPVFKVRKDWLEEIKDEPMSAEECLKRDYPETASRSDTWIYSAYYVAGFRAGAAENEKKHRPQQIFDEWLDSIAHSTLWKRICADEARAVWQACLRSHNLPEEN
ncbi:hypothetical protein KKI24_07210 [bacterium]|nr:hypothetical protein [bacterium]